jgi:hypothetical protein
MRGGPTATVALVLFACASRPPPPPAAPAPPPVVAPPAPSPSPPPPHELAAPPIALTVIDSPTAQVFQIVDELSGWYPEANTEYAAWAKKELPLDDSEREMIAKHAKLRAKRRRGGLDAAFDVDAPIVEAARAGVEKKLLTAADAADEEALLEHFEPRLQPFLASQAKAILALEAQIATELPRAAPLWQRFGRFCEVTETLPLRAVLVPSPARRGGGRASRTTILVEVPASEDALPTLFHYLAHAVLLERRGTIAVAGRKCDERIDDQTLEDALAYAFAPGLVPPGEGDRLRELVDSDRAGSLREPHVRAERLALAIRSELSAALEGGNATLASFMPNVCDEWAKLAKP